MGVKKIVIIGPESTGKSTLSRQLAAHYGTVWCPEYAREYLTKYGTAYSYDDLLTIAKGQLAKEDELAAQARNGLYFVDTNMYVMKVWCEVVFGNCHTWILQQIVERTYDHYLLCRTDLPWEADELREYPDDSFREKLYRMYRDAMINSGVGWTEVWGSNEQRLQRAIEAVEALR